MADPQFHLPEAAIIGRETMPDGASIRTLLLMHDRPVANLLLLTGRADFHEKWADAIASLWNAGFSIASFDWRGQGGSTRLTDSGAGHIDSFDTWLADLDRLSDWALRALSGADLGAPTSGPGLGAPTSGRRWLALGHSMGGHLLTRWVGDPARWALPFQQELDGVVLAAPFFGLGGPAVVKTAALSVAPLQVARGRAADFAWGQTPYGKVQRRPERQLLLTGSRAHFEDEGLWVEAHPELATGGVSWGWIQAFAQSRRALEALPLERLPKPVLMLLAAREKLVDNKAAIRVATRMPDCDTHIVSMAAHELLREAEPARQDVLGQIIGFANRVVG